MPDLSQITGIMDAIVLPLMGCVALMFAKLTQGEAARWAERQFFAALVVITVVTARTVMMCDDAWLLHTTTLGVMTVGALVIPSQDTLLAV
ncbi:hypothetical protein [Rubripirellula reticaptiva]|uniref:Uncharacterized protein n=1 Tax=Rubripirellula reticaptiva TaxID=2528013 RepID=A0A5C6F5B2_9BACT|nr:hypothetical protein [Rubripirellula reticaptiva]TWU55039.1 hypothetical protein Poly59_13320 [Rubripirellula reticaptiva]